jgi:uracil-DNA glycosylase
MNHLAVNIQPDLFYGTAGPRDARCILVGEAWGAEEAGSAKPFAGQSGRELFRMLHEAFSDIAPALILDAIQERNFGEWLRKRDLWLNEASILLANVVAARPPQNDFQNFLYPTAEKKHDRLYRGIYCKPELVTGVRSLIQLIAIVQPDLVVVAGAWPLWALTDAADVKTTAGYKLPSGIAKWRGSQLYTRELEGLDEPARLPDEPSSAKRCPCLPILHPANILRDWGQRSVTVNDLRRAARFLGPREPQSDARGLRTGTNSKWAPPSRTFTFWKPSWKDITNRFDQWRRKLTDGSELWLAVDLETWKRRYISVVGIADADCELCVPLFTVAGGKVTPYLTMEQEKILWTELKYLLEHPNVRIYGQNFIYDTEWLHRYYNIRAIVAFDTMVAHHLLFPGTPKRLDYLASLYCDHFVYWKDESGNWDAEDLNAEQLWKYSCKDTRATFEIGELLRKVIEQQGLTPLYQERMEAWTLARTLTLRGTLFDQHLQKEMRLQLLEEANSLSQWLLNAVPPTLQYTSTGKPWFDSPKGTANLLYEVLGLTKVEHKKTGKPTTDDAALAELCERPSAAWLEPLLSRLRHLRSVGKFVTGFLDARVSADGRMRSTFNIAHPETFRWSSNRNGFGEGLNGQNIPKGDKVADLEEEETEDAAVDGSPTD